MNLDKTEIHTLHEIERLWGAPYDSPEGDKLDVLATLVVAYEEKHHFINPIV